MITMKYFFVLFINCLVLFNLAKAQRSSANLNDSWTNLKLQLHKKAELYINVATFSQRIKHADKNIINKIMVFALALENTIAIKDTISVQLISIIANRNDSLIIYLPQLVVQFNKDKKLNSSTTLSNYEARLEGTENRIALAIYDYNETCKLAGRQDLYFNTMPIDQAPKIEF